MQQYQNHRFVFIEHLRVLAFISVLIGHLYFGEYSTMMADPNPSISIPFKFSNSFFAGGGGGVVLFFLISGFVITKAAERETYRTFAIRRFFRIYPMLILSLFLFAIYQFSSEGRVAGVRQSVGSISLLGDFLGVENQLGGVEWSLRLEILFYFSAFLFLVLYPRRIFRNIKINLFLIFASIAVIVLPIFPSQIDTYGYVTIFAPVFLGGIALALYDSRKISFLLTSYLVIASFVASSSSQTSIRSDTLWAGPILLFGYSIFILSYALRKKFGTNKILALLASYTYTVYLLHKWMIPWIEATLTSWFDLDSEPFLRLLALCIFFGIAHMLVTYVEKPMIRWSRAAFERGTQLKV